MIEIFSNAAEGYVLLQAIVAEWEFTILPHVLRV